MKLKMAQRVLQVGTVLAILCFVGYSFTHVELLLWVALGLVFAIGGTWLAFGRCPHCGHYLGRAQDGYCPSCGKKTGL